jgi:hypothetical protein
LSYGFAFTLHATAPWLNTESVASRIRIGIFAIHLFSHGATPSGQPRRVAHSGVTIVLFQGRAGRKRGTAAKALAHKHGQDLGRFVSMGLHKMRARGVIIDRVTTLEHIADITDNDLHLTVEYENELLAVV